MAIFRLPEQLVVVVGRLYIGLTLGLSSLAAGGYHSPAFTSWLVMFWLCTQQMQPSVFNASIMPAPPSLSIAGVAAIAAASSLCVLVFCLHISLSSTCVLGVHRGWKRVSGPLDLYLQTVVNCPVGVRDPSQVLWKNITTEASLRPQLGLLVDQLPLSSQLLQWDRDTCTLVWNRTSVPSASQQVGTRPFTPWHSFCT